MCVYVCVCIDRERVVRRGRVGCVNMYICVHMYNKQEYIIERERERER